jgi:hypothetical protein
LPEDLPEMSMDESARGSNATSAAGVPGIAEVKKKYLFFNYVIMKLFPPGFI